MEVKPVSVSMALALAVAVSACEKSSPTRPSDVAADASTAIVSDAKAGVTITAPQLVTPTDGQRFRFTDQQLTLTIKNAAATGSSTVTYTFQVATDAAFGSIVYSKDGVAEGNGQTSLKIDKLAGNKDYFWRARANVGSLAGPFAKGRAFNVGPEVVLQAPALTAPANNGQAGGSVLTLTVANADRSGPVTQIVYHFEISDTSAFGSLVATANVPEQAGGQTTAQINARLTTNATYYWRAQATDPASGVVGPFSSVSSFKYVPFDLRQAIILNSPQDLAIWDEAAKITRVTFTGEAFLVDFDKRQGPGKWPEMVPPGWKGGIQYTLGMCVNPSGNQWYCSAVVQFWDGRELEASTPPSYVGRNWFYDSRWGPILGYNPSDGETVGLFVGAGNLRDGQNLNLANCPRVCERSNVQMVTWQNGGFANYVYSLAKTVLPTLR
jgi:hypothetical protein